MSRKDGGDEHLEELHDQVPALPQLRQQRITSMIAVNTFPSERAIIPSDDQPRLNFMNFIGNEAVSTNSWRCMIDGCSESIAIDKELREYVAAKHGGLSLLSRNRGQVALVSSSKSDRRGVQLGLLNQ